MDNTIQEQRELQHSGFLMDNPAGVVVENYGSETALHAHAKLAACRLLRREGYTIRCEIPVATGEVCDVLAYGHESRKPIVVEIQQDMSEEESKRETFQRGPIREVFVVPMDELGSDVEQLEYGLASYLGFL